MAKRPKILILRFSSIGDIVLTTPVIRCIKQQLNAEVHYCTKAAYKSILEENPHIDQIHCLENSIGSLVKTLKKEKFDYVIDLHRNMRTRIIKFRLGRKSFSFSKINYKKWLMVKFKINKLPHSHIVDRYMVPAEKIGVKNDGEGLEYYINQRDHVENEWLPETHQNGFVAFAIGGQHTTKKLPREKLIHLCDMINKPIILLGGKEDIPAADELEEFFKPIPAHKGEEEALAQLNKKAVIFNGVGKFNLNQSASILKQANYVFTHDTGLMHMAAAFGKEIYSIWGNTIPMFGMFPYKTKFTVFENNNISCRPCSKIGYNKCPKRHFKCMNEIVFDFYLP